MNLQFDELSKARDEAVQTGGAVLSTAFEGARRLAELNLKTLRGSFEHGAGSMRQMFSMTDPKAVAGQAAAELRQAGAAESNATVDYVREVFVIGNDTFTRIQSLLDRQAAANQKLALDSLEQYARSAPAGAEGVVSFARQGIEQAGKVYGQLSQQSRQLVDLVEANVVGATKAAARAPKAAARMAA